MSAFRVDLAQLEALVDRLSQVEAHLIEVHDDVEARMRRLRVTWAGRAATEHQLAYEHWSSGSHDARDALQRLRTIATTAHENYCSARAANQMMWSR